MAEEMVSRAETVQRRPEYIERLEKALLSGIFGTEVDGDLSGGIIQDPNLFRVAPYQIAGQIGRDPETGAIVGLGPETFASQFVMEDLNNDGRPDFLERYSDFFDTAGDATKSGVSAIESGIGQIADAEDYFPTAKTAVQSGQGMYRPSDYVSDFMSPYTTGVIEQVEKDIERQGNVARQRAAAQAVGRGAFGGSRQGIQAAEVERSIQDAKAKATADLRARNYEQALAASQQAYQQGQTRDLEAGRLLGGLGQSVGQLGTAYGGLGSQFGSLAGTTADIGRVYSALQPADLAFMTGVGEAERAYRQQMIDTARQEFQRPTEQALLPYQFAYGALTGTPSAGIYSQTQAGYAPPANPFLSGLGAYTTLQGINQAS